MKQNNGEFVYILRALVALTAVALVMPLGALFARAGMLWQVMIGAGILVLLGLSVDLLFTARRLSARR